ncbi:MAG: hemerythrin-like metal-binding protein [Alphaproteobacteria bacterium]|nr:MAG: hemerythrin-like metal-binding protein [Alphaproteobacteria bacterium]
MALIEWRPEFEIGIPAVDHEHRELIGLINRLYDTLSATSDAAEIEAFLGEIYARISAHFALEERTMRDLRYDEYDAHKADHERLLDEIRDIMETYQAGAYRDLERDLGGTLEHWFTEHFRIKDARLHKFLAARGAGAA